MPTNLKNKNLRVAYAQAVYDQKEIDSVISVLRQHREAMGREVNKFETKIARLFGKKHAVMVNSGSSALILALELLRLPKGSEIITPVLTFSTTVAPIIKAGLIPVFVDVEEGKYVIDVNKIESLITKKTKALIIPLLLGSVPDMQKLQRLAKRHRLFLIEDACDTLGPTFNLRPTGKYSDITVTSFYGSHIITAAGNGGMIMVNNPLWKDRLRVLRGWGRSSAIFSESEDIKKRFKGKVGGKPYDAKFIFEDIGYNFLPSEIGAAFGNVQLGKFIKFRHKREVNFKTLSAFFKQYGQFFILPFQHPRVRTQWLAFPLTIKKSAPFSRLEITTFLEKNNVQTRPVLTGNLLKQPGFKNIIYKSKNNKFPVADEITDNSFVIGCHQGLEKAHLDKVMSLFSDFLKHYL